MINSRRLVFDYIRLGTNTEQKDFPFDRICPRYEISRRRITTFDTNGIVAHFTRGIQKKRSE